MVNSPPMNCSRAARVPTYELHDDPVYKMRTGKETVTLTRGCGIVGALLNLSCLAAFTPKFRTKHELRSEILWYEKAQVARLLPSGSVHAMMVNRHEWRVTRHTFESQREIRYESLASDPPSVVGMFSLAFTCWKFGLGSFSGAIGGSDQTASS